MVAYALLLECVLFRELSVTRDLPNVVRRHAGRRLHDHPGAGAAFTNYLIWRSSERGSWTGCRGSARRCCSCWPSTPS
jgi:hypothetical protein